MTKTGAGIQHAGSEGQVRFTLREIAFGPRLTDEQHRITFGLESQTRPANDSAEKPAKTTEWTAPMRAHASCKPTQMLNFVALLPRWSKATSKASQYMYHTPHEILRCCMHNHSYHGRWQLHNHGHVNGDVIAFLDTYAFEIVSNSADHLQQFCICDFAVSILQGQEM